MNRLFTFTTLSVLLLLSPISAPASECLTIANSPINVKAQFNLVADVKETFRLAGLCSKIVSMPSPRIKREMIRGNLDGEFFRVSSYMKTMTDHVVLVPTPAINNSGVIVTLKNSGFAPGNIKEVGNKTIGIVRGSVWNESLVGQLKNIVRARSNLQLVELLLRKRLDGLLIATSLLDRLELEGKVSPDQIHRSGIVISFTLHLVLHKKHAALVEKLDQALQKVKKRGGFDGN